MTISLAWVRRNRAAMELVVASDSRLRSRGAINQAQKIIRLERGDCALSFCGDTHVAYPLFMQVGSTLNNFIKTRSRANDITILSNTIGLVLNALVGSWDLPEKEKADDLKDTRIVLSGWSWRTQNFYLGIFEYKDGRFKFKRELTKLHHPWYQKKPSFLFVGDYKDEFLQEMSKILAEKYGTPSQRDEKRFVDLEYEPLSALRNLLARSSAEPALTAIGGAPQILKIYPFSQSLPFVVRTNTHDHYLFGRKLFEWEKTEYPIVDVSGDQISFLYPMSAIPLPEYLQERRDENSAEDELQSEHITSVAQIDNSETMPKLT